MQRLHRTIPRASVDAFRFLGLTSILTVTACGAAEVDFDAIDEVAGDEIAGELQVHIINYEDGTAIERYVLLSGATDIELEFAKPPSVATGERIAVRGVKVAERRVRVESYRVLTVDDTVVIDDGLTGNTVNRRSKLAVLMVQWTAPMHKP